MKNLPIENNEGILAGRSGGGYCPKIQIIRAISAFAVVIIHFNANGPFAVLDRPFVNFGTAMFTFISGYLTNITIKDFNLFYRKRILKVLIPYIVWTFVYCIGLGKFGSVVKCLITGSAAAPLYYILVYIQLVILTPLIGRLIQSKYSILGWLVTPVYILLTRYIGNGMSYPVSAQTLCLAWFIYYYLGMQLGNKTIDFNLNLKEYKLWVLYAVAIVLSICEGAIWFYEFNNSNMATTQLRMTSIVTSLTACLIAYGYINNGANISKGKISRLLISMGNCSFGIYFSHMAVGIVINKISEVTRLQFLQFPVKAVLVFGVAYMLSFIGKKILGRFSWMLGL